MRRLVLFALAFWACTLLHAQSPKLLPVKVNYKWGYVDMNGKIIMPPRYDYAEEFKNMHYAMVEIKGKKGLIDTNGKEILPPNFTNIEPFDEHTIKIAEDSLWGLRKITGEVLCPVIYSRIEISDSTHYLISNKNAWGMMDTSGKIIIPVQYDTIRIEGKYIIPVSQNRYGIYTKDGKEFVPCILTDYEILTKDLIICKDSVGWYGLDEDSTILFKGNYSYVESTPNNRYLFLSNENGRLLYSTEDKKIISDTTYDYYVADDNKDYIYTVRHKKMGIITRKGEVISDPLYRNIIFDPSGIFKINKDGRWGLMNQKGAVLYIPALDHIGEFKNGVTLTINKGRYGIINIKGKTVHPCTGDRVVIKNREAEVFTGEEKVYYTFDAQGNVIDKVEFHKIKTLTIASRDIIKIDTVSRFSFVSRPARRGGGRGGIGSVGADEYGWFLKGGKWGLQDTSGKLFIPNFLDDINVYPELGLTLVGYMNKDYGMQYGIVDHEKRKFVLRPSCEDIFIEDFENGEVARIIQLGMKYGLLTRSGRIITQMVVKENDQPKSVPITYIGDFSEDMARINVGGKVTINPTTSGSNILFYARNNRNKAAAAYGGTWGYINRDGKFSIEPQYQSAGDFKLSRAIVKMENSWGVIDNKGKFVIPNNYGKISYIPKTNDSLFLLEKFQTKSGIINEEGKIIIEPQFDDIGEFSQGFAKARMHGRWGFISPSADTLTDFKFDETKNFTEGLAAVKVKSKWGYINLEGDMAISPQFDFAGDFHGGLAMVKVKGKIGYIDQSGKIIIETKYLKGTDFYGNLAAVKKKRKFGLINKEGKWVVKPAYKKVEFTSNGSAIVKAKKYGLINNSGKHLLKCKFKKINPFFESRALVFTTKHGAGYIDSTGKFVIHAQYKNAGNFSEGVAKVLINNKYGYINKAGEIVINPTYRTCSEFKEGKAFVTTADNKSGFINKSGEIIIPFKSNTPLFFQEGFALVKTPEGVYYINAEGKAPFKKEFSGASPFTHGLAIISKGGTGIMNKDGIVLISPKYSIIHDYTGKYAEVINTSFKGIADRNGKIVIPANYEVITFNNKLQIFKVEKGDYLGYLDIFGNWIWKSTK
ncbi:MAG: WG repeat-containing protein [Cytophagaceae bacterium]|nr:WG repeat-containing protein [Cytophagaceae bacterium]